MRASSAATAKCVPEVEAMPWGTIDLASIPERGVRTPRPQEVDGRRISRASHRHRVLRRRCERFTNAARHSTSSLIARALSTRRARARRALRADGHGARRRHRDPARSRTAMIVDAGSGPAARCCERGTRSSASSASARPSRYHFFVGHGTRLAIRCRARSSDASSVTRPPTEHSGSRFRTGRFLDDFLR